MKLQKYSRNRLMQTFSDWEVPRDFADPMFNYLVYGYRPGSCFTGVLANDFYGAIRNSHPANTIQAFKALAGWIIDTVPSEARGSYELVEAWCDMTSDMRRPILEKHGLIYAEEDEAIMILSGARSVEPHLW